MNLRDERILRLERDLLLARKQQALGLLASGMAHDFNNALSAISGYAELLRRRFGGLEPEVLRYSEVILASCSRAAEMVDRLKIFTRKDRRQVTLIDAHMLLEELQGITEVTMPGRYRITWDLGASTAWITGDPNLFQGIVLHLLVLARDVLPKGGNLTIRTSNFSARLGQKAPETVLALDLVSSDDRIDWEILQRVISGTTNEIESAGIMVVREFLEIMGGVVALERVGGQTARIRLLFPLTMYKAREMEVDEENLALLHSDNILPELPEATGDLVVVVDDEAGVRDLLSELIRGALIPFRACSCGDEVKSILDSGLRIKSILVDQHLGAEDGLALCEFIRQVSPQTRIALMTGYAIEMDTRVLQLKGISLFEKPFDIVRIKAWLLG
jgi:CheY-like chemotaxis protein